jgi:alpha-N-arabinofuranosidase
MTDAACLPDWDDFPLWNDQTIYNLTLVVAQDHPSANDANAGSAERPLKTIQAALERVQPGQRVVVYGGVYRERLCPRRGGADASAMISLEAAPGVRVVVRGSRPLAGDWERPRPWEKGFGAGEQTPCLSQFVWRLRLDGLVPEELQTVLAANVEPSDEVLMPWMAPVSGRPPFTLRRGLLFQDGRRLTQVHHAGDLPRVPGSYWFEADGSALLVHAFGGGSPARHRMELAVQSALLCPDEVGLGYIRLSGITFEHCANAFLRTGTGAVNTLGGHHWIVEHCVFREINSTGLEFSDHPFEHQDTDPRNPGRGWMGQGHMLVRRNRFAACGTAGIRCLHVSEARVLGNLIEDCGWQDAEYYYECAGIKLLVTRHTLVANNHIRNLVGACGIWLDWDNRGSRVTRNLIRDIRSIQGGIFVEASHHANLVDHNLIWNMDGPGIFGGDSSFQLYRHNLIAFVEGEPLRLFCHTDRSVGTRPVTCIGNQVTGNLFLDPPPHRADAADNTFAANVVVRTRALPGLDLAAWQARGFDADLRELRGEASLSADGTLRWTFDAELPPDAGPLPLQGKTGERDVLPRDRM